MEMEEKITIIEGPPPTFEVLDEGWAFGLAESPFLSEIAVTHLRTYNGPALVERCHRAWRKQLPIHLEYRDSEGVEQRAPIIAARTVETDGGQVLILWVRLHKEDAEVKISFSAEDDEYMDDEYDLDEEFLDDEDFGEEPDEPDSEDVDQDSDDFFGPSGGGNILPPAR
jgi:hypothetical protein